MFGRLVAKNVETQAQAGSNQHKQTSLKQTPRKGCENNRSTAGAGQLEECNKQPMRAAAETWVMGVMATGGKRQKGKQKCSVEICTVRSSQVRISVSDCSLVQVVGDCEDDALEAWMQCFPAAQITCLCVLKWWFEGTVS